MQTSIASLEARIQALDSSLSGSPLMRVISSRDEFKKDLPSSTKGDSIPSKGELPPSRPTNESSWESEWASLRLQELKLMKQHRGEDVKSVLKRDGRRQWALRNQGTVSWQMANGWSQEQAESYTCVALGGQTALAQDIRQGTTAFGASRQLLLSVLAERALLSTATAPPTYRHLTGLYSLTATDPSWRALLAPDAAPGLCFSASALTIATDDANALDAKGYRVRLSTSSNKHFYEPQDSDVVCFRALPTEVSGVPVEQSATAWVQTHTARSLVQTSALAWHLPPLATVTLAQVVPPGEWSAYGRTVGQRLLVVNVAFDC